jgi:hypothetical protein
MRRGTRSRKCIAGLKKTQRVSCSLSRISLLLAVDRFRSDPVLTSTIQTFLAGTFLSQEIIEKLKHKFGSENLWVRPIFHSQQVVVLSRFVLLYCADEGFDSENEEGPRNALDKALLLE